MIKRFTLLSLFVLGMANLSTAQDDADDTPQDTSYWTRNGKFSIIFNQVSLTNWAAGGENSLSLASFASYEANYNKDRFSWRNKIDLGYGFQDQDGFNKTDDRISLDMKTGYQLENRWNWYNSLALRTQFDRGFATPERDSVISKFFSPAYLFLSTGIEWKYDDNFYIDFSPVTGKFTFVTDEALNAIGAYGVDPGSASRSEFGLYLKAYFKRDIIKNVNFETKLDIFTNYLENFGDIDVNWENMFVFTINKYLSADLFMHLIYDKDIQFEVFNASGDVVRTSDRVQFKQVFGLALKIDF
jgi:hypothetical protein